MGRRVGGWWRRSKGGRAVTVAGFMACVVLVTGALMGAAPVPIAQADTTTPPSPKRPRGKADVPELPYPPPLPDQTVRFKSVATAYADALRGLCYDWSVVAAMCMQLPGEQAPVTAESKARLAQMRRTRVQVREMQRAFREGEARAVERFPADQLVQASRVQLADLRLHVEADLRTLDEVQGLLSESGNDRHVAYSKAVHLLKELETGERGTRRKATLKAIMALKCEP